MINKISKVTLFVNDQEQAKEFWTKKLNFIVALENQMGPTMKWLEVAPADNKEMTLVLYTKSLMLTHNPEANVEHPNVMFSTKDIEKSYGEMKEKNVIVGELMDMPYGRMFKFEDQDGNEYLLREDK